MKRSAAIAIAAFLLVSGCGGGEEPTDEPPAPASGGDGRGGASPEALGDQPGGGEPGAKKVAPPPGEDPYSESAGGREAILAAAVRSYVSAINRRDGSAVCQLFAPGALASVKLPERRAGCAGSVSASIGHAEPGDLAWRRSRIASIGPAELDPQRPGDARVRAAMVHLFEPGREPSIEDDLIYLRRVGTAWLIAKPSTTLYRAIGAREIPLSVIAPP